MRKIAYSLAAVLLLTACNSENASKPPIEGQSKQEVVQMNEALIGEWQGKIESPQSPLEIISNLEKENGTISVPAQNLSEFPFESIHYNNADAEIEIDWRTR
ncbi:hypothetical protein ACTHOQ_16880 [Solibacillus silvestris]|uniref:hypothetical protein n=1 Tax=Solibacillus silvestris TaxID=76853 RepID=UPI003F81B089